MVPVARRNLLVDKVRFLISVGGVTFAVLLILVVQSLYQGYSHRIGSLAERLPVDLWVSSQDATGFSYVSIMPGERVAEVAGVDGVTQVVRLYGGRYRIRFDDRSIDTYLLSFDLPAAVSSIGLDLPRPGEVFIDTILARDTGLAPGDTIVFFDKSLTVGRVVPIAGAGISQFTLLAATDARETIVVPGYVNYLLVRVVPGHDPAKVAAAINAEVHGVTAMTKAEFAAINRADVSKTFLPIVRVLLVVSFLTGVAVVGITIYTATVERTREYGVLKAIGATRGQLFRIVLTQSLTIGAAGFLLGVPLAYAVDEIAAWLVPEFITLIRWQDVALVLLAALGMAVIATVIPVRRVAAIDPATVFRA